MEEPKRLKLRNATADPKRAQSSTESDDPHRETPNTENAAPSLAKLLKDMFEPK